MVSFQGVAGVLQKVRTEEEQTKMWLVHESLLVLCVCIGAALCCRQTPIPVSPDVVVLSLCGWRSAAQGSSPSTCLWEPGAAFLLPALFALPLHSLSSCRMSVCAASLQDSRFPLSCAAPSVSPPARWPVGECDMVRPYHWSRDSWLITPSMIRIAGAFIKPIL